MKGTVKWFCPDKGYGFVTSDSGDDYYFHASNVDDSGEPGKGDIVSFGTRSGRKGRADVACNVKVLEKGPDILDGPASPDRRTDDRIDCPGCGKKIVPRLIVYHGEPRKSVCPYCAATIRDFSRCFIATAVYEDPYSYQICALRQYRDEVLAKKSLGRVFISVYREVSPSIAKWLESRPIAARTARKLLNIVVRRISKRANNSMKV